MREIELKAVVDDLDARCRAVVESGATLVFEGRLEDRRYDTHDEALKARDEVVRIRTYRAVGSEPRTSLDWKGARSLERGYRVREEHSVTVDSLAALEAILTGLGYRVTKAIDRHIIQFELLGAMVRFERYPRMDDLVEVEGEPAAIERAIALLGMRRSDFTADSLATFVGRYEERTGTVAAVSDIELASVATRLQADGDDTERG